MLKKTPYNSGHNKPHENDQHWPKSLTDWHMYTFVISLTSVLHLWVLVTQSPLLTSSQDIIIYRQDTPIVLSQIYTLSLTAKVFGTTLGVQILLQNLSDVLHIIKMNNESHKRTVKAELCDKVVCVSDQLWHGSTTKIWMMVVQPFKQTKLEISTYINRVIQNDCRGFNNLSYTTHLR